MCVCVYIPVYLKVRSVCYITLFSLHKWRVRPSMKVHLLLCLKLFEFKSCLSFSLYFSPTFLMPIFMFLIWIFFSVKNLRIPMYLFGSHPLLSSSTFWIPWLYIFSNVTACSVSLIALNPTLSVFWLQAIKNIAGGGGRVSCHVKSPPSLPLGKDLNLKHFQSITVQERTLKMFCNTDWFHKICLLDAEVEFLLAYFIIKGNACAVFIVIQIWHK